MTTTDLVETQGTTARERATLRGIVRQQYKVLRNEIDTRVAQLHAEAATRLREKYAAEDAAWEKLSKDIDKVIARAQRSVDKLIEESPVKPDRSGYRSGPRVRVDCLYRPTNSARSRLETEFSNAIKARSREAKLDFDRREADALRDLATEDIKTPAAKAYLDTIPTIQQALPSSDLLAVERRIIGGAE